MKHVIGLFILLAVAPHLLRAQESIFRAALDAFDDGKFTQCVDLLDEIQHSRPPSPRTESLRALALHELGRRVETFRALERYRELTAGMDARLAGNEMHRELLAMLAQYRAALEKERAEKQKELQKQRDRVAEAEVKRTEQAVSEVAQASARRFQDYLASIPPERLAHVSQQDIALLQGTSGSGFAQRFDERLFRIPKLNTGAFTLGMARGEFETALMGRLREALNGNPFLAPLAAGDWMPDGPVVDLGRVVLINDDAREKFAWLLIGSPLRSAAYQIPGFKLETQYPPLIEAHQAMTKVEGTFPRGLLPEGTTVRLVRVRFDNAGQLVELVCGGVLRGEWPQVERVLKGFSDQFGPFERSRIAPDGIRPLDPARDRLRGAAFSFPPVEGVVLSGRLMQSIDPYLAVPWMLEVRLTRLAPGEVAAAPEAAVPAGFEPGEITRHYTALQVNRVQQRADGLPVAHEGRRFTLVLDADAFRLESGQWIQQVGYRDPASGFVEEVVYGPLDLRQLRQTWRMFADEIPAWQRGDAGLVSIHFHRPMPWRGNGTRGEATTVPVYYFVDGDSSTPSRTETVVEEALAAALPAVATLTREEVRNIGRGFDYGGSSRLGNHGIRDLLLAADRLGKLGDPMPLADRLELPESVPYLRRAAEEGEIVAVLELMDHFEDSYRSGQEADLGEFLKWGDRAAAAGHTEAIKTLIEYWKTVDYLRAEELLRKLQALGGKYHSPQEVLERASRLRQLRALPLKKRIKTFQPTTAPTLVGSKIKDLASPKGRFALQNHTTIYARGGRQRDITIYHIQGNYDEGPMRLYVNRKGRVIGEQSYVGRGWRYPEFYHLVRQVFSDHELVDCRGEWQNMKQAVGFRIETGTVQVLQHEQGACFVVVIDHTQA